MKADSPYHCLSHAFAYLWTGGAALLAVVQVPVVAYDSLSTSQLRSTLLQPARVQEDADDGGAEALLPCGRLVVARVRRQAEPFEVNKDLEDLVRTDLVLLQPFANHSRSLSSHRPD